MIKKKHLAIIIAVILMITYSVSMFAVFRISRERAEDDFADSCSYVSEFFEPLIGLDPQADDFEDMSVVSLEDFLFEASFFSTYPTYITLYDENSNKAGTTHSSVWFQKDGVGCTINLEEYITGDIKDKIEKNIDKMNTTYMPALFSYNKTGDKIIPVEMIFEEIEGTDTINLKFTDYPVTDTVEATQEENYFHPFFLYYPKGSYTYDCYNFMQEQRDQYINGKYTYNEDINRCDFAVEMDYCEEVYSITLGDGNIYMAFIQIKTDLNHDALQLHSFQQRAVMITVMYAFIILVLLCVYYSYYKNNARFEKAKYSFTNAAAHELKTPLAVIENQCECILEKINEDKNDEYVNTIYGESLKMSKLLNNLLQYNKLTLSNGVDKESVNLTELIYKEIGKYKSFAEVKNISVTARLDECELQCNRELIALVIDNFLSNAIKYSEGNEIRITLEKVKNKKYKFSVFNYCQPLNDKKVWEQLYVKSDSRSGESSGLGLAISKQILQLHRYKHGFENKDGGVEFYFIAQ